MEPQSDLSHHLCLCQECDTLVETEDGRWTPAEDVNGTDVIDNDTVNVADDTVNDTHSFSADSRREKVLVLMKHNPQITMDNLYNILHVSRRTIARDIIFLRNEG